MKVLLILLLICVSLSIAQAGEDDPIVDAPSQLDQFVGSVIYGILEGDNGLFN